MPITATWSSLNTGNVQLVPAQEGIYELANGSYSIIYIGRSDDLSRRLRDHMNTSDPCLKAAAFFRFEVTSRSEERERELLDEYYRQYGQFPRCNDRR